MNHCRNKLVYFHNNSEQCRNGLDIVKHLRQRYDCITTVDISQYPTIEKICNMHVPRLVHFSPTLSSQVLLLDLNNSNLTETIENYLTSRREILRPIPTSRGNDESYRQYDTHVQNTTRMGDENDDEEEGEEEGDDEEEGESDETVDASLRYRLDLANTHTRLNERASQWDAPQTTATAAPTKQKKGHLIFIEEVDMSVLIKGIISLSCKMFDLGFQSFSRKILECCMQNECGALLRVHYIFMNNKQDVVRIILGSKTSPYFIAELVFAKQYYCALFFSDFYSSEAEASSLVEQMVRRLTKEKDTEDKYTEMQKNTPWHYSLQRLGLGGLPVDDTSSIAK